jgi:hypothetical protein
MFKRYLMPIASPATAPESLLALASIATKNAMMPEGQLVEIMITEKSEGPIRRPERGE